MNVSGLRSLPGTKNFIMNYSMKLVIFNEFLNLKILTIAETRFVPVIVLLKEFKAINRCL